MLQIRDQNVISRLKQPLQNRIQAVGGIQSKKDALGLRYTKQLRRLLPTGIDHLCRRKGKSVRATSRVSPLPRHCGQYGIVDRLGLWIAGRPVIQIDQSAVFHRLMPILAFFSTVLTFCSCPQENRIP